MEEDFLNGYNVLRFNAVGDCLELHLERHLNEKMTVKFSNVLGYTITHLHTENIIQFKIVEGLWSSFLHDMTIRLKISNGNDYNDFMLFTKDSPIFPCFRIVAKSVEVYPSLLNFPDWKVKK